MQKLKKIIIYNKLFKFKFCFLHFKTNFFNFSIFNTIKIFKILINLKNFGVFIPEIFDIQSNWIFSFWKKGFISNFICLKWYFVNKIFLKYLPIFFINLTIKKEIAFEIINKKIPLINIFKKQTFDNKKNLGDYFFKDAGFLIRIDLIYFYIKTFIFLKKYKNV